MKRYDIFASRVPAVLIGAITLSACAGHETKAVVKPTVIVVGHSIANIAAPEAAADAAPQLVALEISKDRFGSGDTVTGHAVTSTNVASVEVRVEGYAMPMKRDSFGHFSMTYTLPNLPSFVKRDYELSVTAANSSGLTAQTTVPIHVH